MRKKGVSKVQCEEEGWLRPPRQCVFQPSLRLVYDRLVSLPQSMTTLLLRSVTIFTPNVGHDAFKSLKITYENLAQNGIGHV